MLSFSECSAALFDKTFSGRARECAGGGRMTDPWGSAVCVAALLFGSAGLQTACTSPGPPGPANLGLWVSPTAA